MATMFLCRLNLCGWLGRAMVLGSFQCRDILLLWHMIGHEPAVLAAGAGRIGWGVFFFLVFVFHLAYPIFLRIIFFNSLDVLNFIICMFSGGTVDDI